MIRAIVLDFDGLIVDTETPIIEAYGDVHAQHGLPFERAEFAAGVGHYDFSFDPWRAFDPTLDRDALEKLRRHYNHARTLRQPILPGIKALLEAAGALKLRIGLASNSPHTWVEPNLERLGLRSHFEFIACRGDVPSPKPEPDIYKLVLNQFGLRGHEAIAFEDSNAGSLAAKRAGLWVVTIPNPSTTHHDFAHSHLQLTSLAERTLEQLIAHFGG
jgi:HAD superfamily hydrolase (TIGR01509 family)